MKWTRAAGPLESVRSLQTSGVAVASTTRIAGRLCIRVCIANHRTREADLEIFANAIDEVGSAVEID